MKNASQSKLRFKLVSEDWMEGRQSKVRGAYGKGGQNKQYLRQKEHSGLGEQREVGPGSNKVWRQKLKLERWADAKGRR